MTGEPNYASGDDFSLEFLGYRYSFGAQDFEERVTAAAVKLELIRSNDLDDGEINDLVELAADGRIAVARSGLGAYLVRHWERLALVEGESLVYWLRKLVFRGAYLDQRVKEGLLEITWDEESAEFGYAEPKGVEAAQNPIGDLISLPFQNNTNFGVGHSDHTQNVLNIQPVYPVRLNESWNLITRPILPVISQPPFFSGRELAALEEVFGPGIGDTEFGLGDLTTEFFFSPRKPIQLGPHSSLVWGVGPVLQFPTATDELLGTEKWSAGPDFVVFLSDQRLHITTGFLILNVWSFAGDEDRADVNAMTLQPFLQL
jgi:hypothetical protein